MRLRRPSADDADDPLDLFRRLRIGAVDVPSVGMGDDRHGLTEVVVDHDLVEQHEVGVLEPLLVRGGDPQGRFGVSDVVVGEVAHEPSGEGREAVDAGAPVIREDPSDDLGRVVGLELPRPPVLRDPDLPVVAYELQHRFESEDGVSAPSLSVLDALEDVAVVILVHERPEGLDRGPDIRGYRARHGDRAVPFGCVLPGFFERWAVHLRLSLSL